MNECNGICDGGSSAKYPFLLGEVIETYVLKIYVGWKFIIFEDKKMCTKVAQF